MEFDSSFRTPPSPQLFGQNYTIFDWFSQVKRRTRSTAAERKLRNLDDGFQAERDRKTQSLDFGIQASSAAIS